MLAFLLLMIIALAALSAFWMSMKMVSRPIPILVGAGPPVRAIGGSRTSYLRNKPTTIERYPCQKNFLTKSLRGCSGGISA